MIHNADTGDLDNDERLPVPPERWLVAPVGAVSGLSHSLHQTILHASERISKSVADCIYICEAQNGRKCAVVSDGVDRMCDTWDDAIDYVRTHPDEVSNADIYLIIAVVKVEHRVSIRFMGQSSEVFQ